MKEIPLSQGKIALVDDEDYDYLMQWSWNYHSGGYAARNGKWITETQKAEKRVFMHRVVNKTPDGLFTDHINRNKLDNRKENLRSITKENNPRNRGKDRNSGSDYKGIYKTKSGKWATKIGANKKQIPIGTFDTIEEAIDAYNEAAKKYHGEYASLNEIGK